MEEVAKVPGFEFAKPGYAKGIIAVLFAAILIPIIFGVFVLFLEINFLIRNVVIIENGIVIIYNFDTVFLLWMLIFFYLLSIVSGVVTAVIKDREVREDPADLSSIFTGIVWIVIITLVLVFGAFTPLFSLARLLLVIVGWIIFVAAFVLIVVLSAIFIAIMVGLLGKRTRLKID